MIRPSPALPRPAAAVLRALALSLLLAVPAAAAPLPELSARYALSTRGITVARAELLSRHTAAGYELTARVEGGGLSGLFGELGRADLTGADLTGAGRVGGRDSRPLSFVVHARAPFTAASALLYDWAAQRLDARHGETAVSYPLDDALADPLAFLARLVEARRAGRPAPPRLRVPYASGIAEYRIEALGSEDLATALGPRHTEKYELSRADGGSGRVRIAVWLSPSDDWLPVLGVRSRKQKERARAEIESVSRP